MDLRDKKIGFAMCGSFCTVSLIQLNDLIVKLFRWVHFSVFTARVGAFLDFSA